MPEHVTALVCADDFVSAVAAYADRVHDLLRRVGCDPDQAVEATESYALALLDALVNRPESVVDMAGWWFSRVLTLGDQLGGNPADDAVNDGQPAGDAPTSVLAGTAAEERVRAALANLPAPERAAIVLRDTYDLPPQAVAVALRRPAELADSLVARGRLALVAGYDDTRAPTLADHPGRPPELVALSRLADSSQAPADANALHRHVRTCTRCEDVVEALARARRLAHGLPVIALPDQARERLLTETAARAHATLPTPDEVLLAADADEPGRPLVSPLVVMLGLALAALLGVGVAAATRSSSAPTASGASPNAAPSAAVTPAFPTGPTSTAATPSAAASASASRAATSTSPPPSAPTAGSAAGTPANAGTSAAITLSRSSGPNGATVEVTGTGWRPGSTVQLNYQSFGGHDTGSGATALTDASGRFATTIAAEDPAAVPGPHTVQATNGDQQASASYLATT